MTPPVTDDEAPPQALLPSTQQSSGRKAVRRDRAKAYRKIQELEKQLTNARRSKDRYRKKCDRLTIKLFGSALKKTNTLLKQDKTTLRRKLLSLNTVVSQLKRNYRASKNNGVKSTIKGAIVETILEKYKTQKIVRAELRIRSDGVKPKSKSDW